MSQQKRADLLASLIVQESRDLIKRDPYLQVILPVIKLVENPDFDKAGIFVINCVKIEN